MTRPSTPARSMPLATRSVNISDEEFRVEGAIPEPDPCVDEAEHSRARAGREKHRPAVVSPPGEEERQFGARPLHGAAQQQDQARGVAGRDLGECRHHLGEERRERLSNDVSGDDGRHAPQAEEQVEGKRPDESLRDEPGLDPGEVDDTEHGSDRGDDDDFTLRPTVHDERLPSWA